MMIKPSHQKEAAYMWNTKTVRINIISIFIIGAQLLSPQQATCTSILRVATGPADGTYRILGSALKRAVEARSPHIKLELVQSYGSLDNMRLLKSGSVDLAFVQSDIVGQNAAKLSSDGKKVPWQTIMVLFQEPVQVVADRSLPVDRLAVVSGQSISLGRKGGGTFYTCESLLASLHLNCNIVDGESASDVQGLLQHGTINAGFFIANPPTPQVAALLSDPDYKLLSLNTKELSSIMSVSPYYLPTDIPENTYPHQSKVVHTVSVLNVLVCRANISNDTIKSIASAILEDAGTPDGNLRSANSAINVPQIVYLSNRSPIRLHPGAQMALRNVPLNVRMESYLQWVEWFALLMITVLIFVVSSQKKARQRLLHLITCFMPRKFAGWIRPLLFYRFLWHIVLMLAVLMLVWLFGTAFMYSLERDANIYFIDLKASALSILVYLFSGLEDRSPVTNAGWTGSLIMLIAGLFVAAYITGRFASEILIQTSGVIRMISNTAKKAILVIGWSPRAERVLKELLGAWEVNMHNSMLTVLANEKVDTNRYPEFDSKGVTFVTGDPFDKKVLRTLGVAEAHSVIVMADSDSTDADARSGLVVLAVRSLCEESKIPRHFQPRVCVEVVNHRKMDLIRDAGADDVICHEDYGLGVLAQCAFSGGISDIYQELLGYSTETCEVYLISSSTTTGTPDIPEDVWMKFFEGKSFNDAATVFNEDREHDNPNILIGVRRNGRLLLNPRNDMRLQKGDELAVISYVQPTPARLRSKY